MAVATLIIIPWKKKQKSSSWITIALSSATKSTQNIMFQWPNLTRLSRPAWTTLSTMLFNHNNIGTTLFSHLCCDNVETGINKREHSSPVNLPEIKVQLQTNCNRNGFSFLSTLIHSEITYQKASRNHPSGKFRKSNISYNLTTKALSFKKSEISSSLLPNITYVVRKFSKKHMKDIYAGSTIFQAHFELRKVKPAKKNSILWHFPLFLSE